MKEMIVDYRKFQSGAAARNFTCLRVRITHKLIWSLHQDDQGLTRRDFDCCTIESILTGCITVWDVGYSAHNRKALQRVVRTAELITGKRLPAIQDVY